MMIIPYTGEMGTIVQYWWGLKPGKVWEQSKFQLNLFSGSNVERKPDTHTLQD